MNKQLFLSCLIGLALSPALSSVSSAQGVGITFVPTGEGAWTTVTNWEQGDGMPAFGFPEGQFNEFATINSGGTAFINTPIPTINGVGGMSIGADSTFELRNGGSMTFFKGLETDRRMVVNGTLRVQGTGTVDVENLLMTSGATLDIDLTDASGTPVTVTDTVLDPEIANGVAALNGTLDLDFSGVTSPTGAFTLIDANSVTGGFTSVNTTGLQPRQSASISTIAGGTNGTLVQASVLNVLSLTVDRGTGNITLDNSHGAAINLDGFRVSSALGSLGGTASPLAGNWTTAANNDANSIVQVFNNAPGSPTYSAAGGSAASIGNGLYIPVGLTQFGVDPEDLVFEYTDPSISGSVFGVVEYSGTRVENNIVLQIDPATGAGQLANTSKFPQQIEAYRVTSEDGSLIAGNWFSFDDNNVNGAFGWSEVSGADANTLFEVAEDGSTLFDSVTTANPNDGFDIGNIFNVGGTEDLVLEFLIAGDNEFTTGEVVYGALQVGDPAGDGDFDSDGDVDGSDFLAWQRNDGTLSGLSDWQGSYPAAALAAGSAVSAVPEPTSVALIALSALGLVALKPRR